MRSAPFSDRGFTLVELLIVLSILTILAGILLPVFARARENARQSACLSNERQLGMALALYSQDYDARLPAGLAGDRGQGWAGQIYPFVRNVALYKCPDDTGNHRHDEATNNEHNDLTTSRSYRISYAMNCNLAGRPEAGLTAPSNTVLLFEVNDATADMTRAETVSPTGRGMPRDNCPECGKPFGADYYATGNVGDVAPPLSTTKHPYHDPTSNYVAADGHVKALRPEQISPGFNALTPDDPQSGARNTAAGTDSMVISGGVRAALTFSAN
jgi:prepilin-type N-terminal cleavage/methylation domain-containing protein